MPISWVVKIDSSAAARSLAGPAEIDLAADSLNDIADKINLAAPEGVTAAVNAIGPGEFELEISGNARCAGRRCAECAG